MLSGRTSTIVPGCMVSRKGRAWRSGMGVFLLSLLLAPPAAPAMPGEYLLYRPQEVIDAVSPPPEEGILVKNILIRRGDTLSGLSRRYSGKSHYYPQILLFNKIRNPNLIYAGKQLLVPLPPVTPREKSRPAGVGTPAGPKQVVVSPPSGRHVRSSADAGSGEAERLHYERALALFNQRKYDEAIDAFSRFLNKYPHSSLAPEVGLHRADCFLKLSGD